MMHINYVSKKKIMYTAIVIFLSFSIILFINYFSKIITKNEFQPALKTQIPKYYFERETFVSVDYIFNNEGLNKPTLIRENPVTKEFIVLDRGNNCLYFFNSKGEFVRKIGRPGQGPGDLIRPFYFAVDKEGNIYVYENGNFRFSMFDKDGIFIKTFRLRKNYHSFLFSIAENNDIIANLTVDEHYISIISNNGEITKEIGEITKYNNEKNLPGLSRIYADSYVFRNVNGKYIALLMWLPIIKIYDDNGNLINEISLEKEIEIKRPVLNPGNLKGPGISTDFYYRDVFYKNNCIYAIMYRAEEYNGKDNYIIYVLDEEYKAIKKVYLPLESHMKNAPIPLGTGCLEIKGDMEDIFLIKTEEAEIIKYMIK